jgi:hypothetical protein
MKIIRIHDWAARRQPSPPQQLQGPAVTYAGYCGDHPLTAQQVAEAHANRALRQAPTTPRLDAVEGDPLLAELLVWAGDHAGNH